MSAAHTPGPYAGYSTERLKEQHAYWMSVERGARRLGNRDQLARCDRNLSAIGTELRARAAGVQS